MVGGSRCRRPESPYRHLRIFVWLESFGIILVSALIPGDSDVVYMGTLIVGVFAIVTAGAAFSPQLSRALGQPRPERT